MSPRALSYVCAVLLGAGAVQAGDRAVPGRSATPALARPMDAPRPAHAANVNREPPATAADGVDAAKTPAAAGVTAGSSSTSQLAELEQDEKDTQNELHVLTQTEDQLRERLISRGRLVYRLLRMGLLPAGGGFSDFVEHTIRVGRVRSALEHDLGQMQQLAQRKTALAKKLEEIAVHKAPLELEREAAARARVLLGEAEDRRRAFQHAFERSTGAGDYIAVYGADFGPDPAKSAEGFRTQRGRLPFPLAGRTEVRVVRRPGAGGLGVELGASEGAVVRAVYPGRVAFADRYDPFGQIVILDHGDHYYTLAGNLGSTDVRVGDDLSAGARLGTVGQGPQGPVLYFEIRRGANTLDPKPWLGL